MPRSTKRSLSVTYTNRFRTLFFKLNASHTSLISNVEGLTSWKLLRLLVWNPLKIQMKNFAVPMYSSGTVYSLYKVFTNIPFCTRFTQICALFFLPTFREQHIGLIFKGQSELQSNIKQVATHTRSAFKCASFAEHKIKTAWRTEKFFNKQQTRVFAEWSRKSLVTGKDRNWDSILECV
jgi:hypothetical protein